MRSRRTSTPSRKWPMTRAQARSSSSTAVRAADTSCSSDIPAPESRRPPASGRAQCTTDGAPGERVLVVELRSAVRDGARRRTAGGSGAQRHAALQTEPAPLALGEAAPDAEPLVVAQRVLQALQADRAADADPLGLAGRAALLREEGLRIGLGAEGVQPPRLVAGFLGSCEGLLRRGEGRAAGCEGQRGTGEGRHGRLLRDGKTRTE